MYYFIFIILTQISVSLSLVFIVFLRPFIGYNETDATTLTHKSRMELFLLLSLGRVHPLIRGIMLDFIFIILTQNGVFIKQTLWTLIRCQSAPRLILVFILCPHPFVGYNETDATSLPHLSRMELFSSISLGRVHPLIWGAMLDFIFIILI